MFSQMALAPKMQLKQFKLHQAFVDRSQQKKKKIPKYTSKQIFASESLNSELFTEQIDNTVNLIFCQVFTAIPVSWPLK